MTSYAMIFVGIVLGIAIAWLFTRALIGMNVIGIFHIDLHDPFKDRYLIEFTTDRFIDSIADQKYILLKVDSETRLGDNYEK